MQKCLYAAKSQALKSFARVPSINYIDSVKLVDTGIDGIIVPHVETLKDLEKIKKSFLTNSKGGERSISPFVPRLKFSKIENKEIDPLIGILIESNLGIKNAYELISNDIVDFVYFGAYDLSIENNLPGKIFDDEILEKLKLITKISLEKNKNVMAICRNEEELKTLIEYGVSNPVFFVDTAILKNYLTNFYEKFKELE